MHEKGVELLMASTISTTFLGSDHIGVSMFETPIFTTNSESVYLNGVRLVRTIDYTSVSTDPVDPNLYSRILLDDIKYPTGIPNPTDLLEVLTDYVGTPAIDPILEDILVKLEDIAVATFGSWKWSKRDGLLTMYDPDGNEKFKFNVNDTSEEAVRERRQDLEVI